MHAAAGTASEGTDIDLAALMNAVIKHGVPPMHGLGIEVIELSPGHVVGAAPLPAPCSVSSRCWAAPCL